MSAAYAWYRRSYPDGPEYEPRLFDVLCSIAAPYNLDIVRDDPRPMFPRPVEDWARARMDIAMATTEYPTIRRADGGFRPWGSGMMVVYRGSLGTFDGSELTRLVMAAHEHRVRVEISPYRPEVDSDLDEDYAEIGGGVATFQIALTPRDPEGSNFSRHPGLPFVMKAAAGRIHANA